MWNSLLYLCICWKFCHVLSSRLRRTIQNVDEVQKEDDDIDEVVIGKDCRENYRFTEVVGVYRKRLTCGCECDSTLFLHCALYIVMHWKIRCWFWLRTCLYYLYYYLYLKIRIQTFSVAFNCWAMICLHLKNPVKKRFWPC